MRSLIVVHPRFDRIWPFAADRLHSRWQSEGNLQFVRLQDDDRRTIGQIAEEPATISRLIVLGVPVTANCIEKFSTLEEAVCENFPEWPDESPAKELFAARGVNLYTHHTEGFWGQSVAEFGLALTLCGLRRIPQLHHQILTDQTPWNYEPVEGKGRPGSRGIQYGDDVRFTNGTISGKRVRIVGAGNIGSRYASFVQMLGADVSMWDPFASEPAFHRAGARREWYLDQLVRDAEIFVPMLPLTDSTRGLITAGHIQALPQGCLVVMVTRAAICDVQALRARLLADELALAADVFDVEPLPLDDPLLGRYNVIHTPHSAGRTQHANEQWADMLLAQFVPRPSS